MIYFRATAARLESYRWRGAGEEDNATEVGGTLVRESSGRVDQSCDAVCLNARTDDGRAPDRCGRRGLLGLEELLARVGSDGAVVSLAEERSHDGKRRRVGEDGAEGDGRRLDRR